MDKTFGAVVNAVTDLNSDRLRLEREVKLLSEGAATQAKIIRELRHELETERAALSLASYDVEFLKRQGRITRLKLRSAKRGRRQAEVAERAACDTLARRDRQVTMLHDFNANLRAAFQALKTSPNVEAMQARAALSNRDLEIASLRAAVLRGAQLSGMRTGFVVMDEIQTAMTQQRQTYCADPEAARPLRWTPFAAD